MSFSKNLMKLPLSVVVKDRDDENSPLPCSLYAANLTS